MKNKNVKMLALTAMLTLSLAFGAVALAAPQGPGGMGGPAPSGQEMMNNNEQPPEKPDGDDGQQPPEKPDGDNSQEPPAKPDGDNGQQPPAKPDGDNGQQPPQMQGMDGQRGPGKDGGPEQMLNDLKTKIDAVEDESTKANLTELMEKLESAMKAEQEARDAFFKAAEEAGVMTAPSGKPGENQKNSTTTTDTSSTEI